MVAVTQLNKITIQVLIKSNVDVNIWDTDERSFLYSVIKTNLMKNGLDGMLKKKKEGIVQMLLIYVADPDIVGFSTRCLSYVN